MRLAMTIPVRDEADIIEANLRYHRAQGVDLFIVGDNGSTDGSLEILERHGDLVQIERLEGRTREVWGEGRARLARIAFERGADWVINNDADEFWWPVSGNLKEALSAVREEFGLVVAPRSEFVARPGGGPFAERLTVREAQFLRPPKVAHRTHPRVTLSGPHPTQIWIDRGGSPRQGLVGRPVRRARAEHAEAEVLDLVMAPVFPAAVLHFPVRSFEQYTRLVETALANRDLGQEEVRAAYEAGRLEDVYAELALDDEQVANGIAAGWLTEDTDFRDYLAACPDPLEGGPAPAGPGGWPKERRDRAIEQLEVDAMYGLSRYLQTIAYTSQAAAGVGSRRGQADPRLERRVRRLELRLRVQRRRLRAIRSSRWWRLRPRLPRARRR